MTELLYIIDETQSRKNEVLTIKIQEGEREGAFLKPLFLPIQKAITKDLLQRLATSRDSALNSFLIKEEIAFVKKQTGNFLDEKRASFNFIRIAHSSVLQALKQFAMSGKLYFNNKQLVIDLYGKNSFHYSIDCSSGSPVAEGWITSDSKEFNIQSCDYIGRGPPHWFIKGIYLKCITTDISWQDLKKIFYKEAVDIIKITEEAQIDVEAPKIIFKDIDTHLHKDPFPVLKLTDRLGAFAELYMNYGANAPLVCYHNKEPNVLDASGKSCYKRHFKAELGWEKDLLETDFIKKCIDNSSYYCPLDKVAKSIAFLLEIGWQILDHRGNRVLQHQKIDLTAEESFQTILIKGKIQYQDYQADFSKIIGAFNRRERFVEISPGYTALLPNKWEQPALDALVDELEIVEGTASLKRHCFGLLQELSESGTKISFNDSIKQFKEKFEGSKGLHSAAPIITPGKGFSGSLRHYQQEGLSWISSLHAYGFHGILADDMGLGKTIQALAFLSTLASESRILIIVPTSLIFNWQREIEHFLPGRSLEVHHGSKRTQTLENLKNSSLILTSYHTLRMDFALFSSLSFSCVILDEAQIIKNSKTQIFQCASKLNSDFRLSITGTPIENDVQELWAHFQFLIPGLLGEESSFQAELQAGISDSRYFKRIKKKIQPFLLRRKKEEVAQDLPEKIEQIVWIEMQQRQRALYEEFLSGFRNHLLSKIKVDGVAKHRMEILESIMRLRQICCDPQLVSFKETAEPIESCKMEILIQDLEAAISQRRKILIYSQFTSMLSLISKRLKENGWNYAYLDGSTKNREKVVMQFQEDPEIPLFLISLKAGGVGLNLTAADCVFIYDPWWNDAIENQAINRAHRIGRQHSILAKRYVVAESIEEKMMKLKQIKSTLSANLLEDEYFNSKLDLEELLFLLT